MPLHGSFEILTGLLRQHDRYWRPFPFREPRLPWMTEQPELTARLLALPPAQVARLAQDGGALSDWLAPWLPFAPALTAAAHWPALPRLPLPALAPRLTRGIPGRKWQQIEPFVAALPVTPYPLLEWCAGKSHLGFVLHHCRQQPVTALERDAALVQQANARARQWQCRLHAHPVDVLSPAVEPFLREPCQQVVALHACGDLHVHLLQQCAAQRIHSLQIAPCCYQKTAEETYRPLSRAARQAALPLHRHERHLAVTETVTAGAYDQRQRRQLQAMRLGFDSLQRVLRGTDQFLPLPSLPMAWARAAFADFCRHCAALKHLELPAQIDWAHYARLGWQRLHAVDALDLVRFLFRRPLESWLVLDRALFLHEQGYRVQLGTFCDRRATPRNLLLSAQLP